MRHLGIVLVILIVVGILSGVQIVSATVSVKNIMVNPSGDLKSGETTVDVSFLIDLVPSGGETFPIGDVLQFSTDLENAHWSYNLIFDGIKQGEKFVNGKSFTIDGWDLSYKQHSIVVDVKLSGIAPVVTTMNKTIFRVSELPKGSSTGTTIASRERMVINPVSSTQGISAMKAALADFRSLIDQKAAAGIDLTEANVKYNEASNAIRTAEQAPNYAVAENALQKVQPLINEGKDRLEKAYTQKLISNAQIPIDQIDQLTTYFISSLSMKASDPQLTLILAKRDRAADLLTDAKDLSAQGKYSDASNKANEASAKGSEALNDALALKAQVAPSGATPQYTSTMIIQTPTIQSVPSTDQNSQVLGELKRQNELIAEQNKILDEQKQLLAEQNKKLQEQSGILDQIVNFFKSIFGVPSQPVSPGKT